MDGNSNVLFNFIILRLVAANDDASPEDVNRRALIGAVIAQSTGLPLAIILTRAIAPSGVPGPVEQPHAIAQGGEAGPKKSKP
jgi:hypothetical protein